MITDFPIPQQFGHNNLVPTPEQMMMHTQSIMHNALIRKAHQKNQAKPNYQKFGKRNQNF